MCDCIKNLEQGLISTTHKGRPIRKAQFPAVFVTENGQFVDRYAVGVSVELEGLKRPQELTVIMRHCPFCGEKLS